MFSHNSKNTSPSEKKVGNILSDSSRAIEDGVWAGLEKFSFGTKSKPSTLKASEMYFSLNAIREKNGEIVPEGVYTYLEENGLIETLSPDDREIKASDLRSLEGELTALEVLKNRRAVVIEEIGARTKSIAESDEAIGAIKPGYLATWKIRRHQESISNNARLIEKLQAESMGILRIIQKLEPTLLSEIKIQNLDLESYAKSSISYVRLSELGKVTLESLEGKIKDITTLKKEIMKTEAEVSRSVSQISSLSKENPSPLDRFVSKFQNKGRIDKTISEERNKLQPLSTKLNKLREDLSRAEEFQIPKPKPKIPESSPKPSPAVIATNMKPPLPTMPATPVLSSKVPLSPPITTTVLKTPVPSVVTSSTQKSQSSPPVPSTPSALKAIHTQVPAPAQMTPTIPLIDQLRGLLANKSFAESLKFFDKNVVPSLAKEKRAPYAILIFEALAREKTPSFPELLTLSQSSLPDQDFSDLVTRVVKWWYNIQKNLTEATEVAIYYQDNLRKTNSLTSLACDLVEKAVELKDLFLSQSILENFSNDLKSDTRIPILAAKLFRRYMNEDDLPMATYILSEFIGNFPVDAFVSNLNELVKSCIENQELETFKNLIFALKEHQYYRPEIQGLVENYIDLLLQENDPDQAENFLAEMEYSIDPDFVVEMEVKISSHGSSHRSV